MTHETYQSNFREDSWHNGQGPLARRVEHSNVDYYWKALLADSCSREGEWSDSPESTAL